MSQFAKKIARINGTLQCAKKKISFFNHEKTQNNKLSVQALCNTVAPAELGTFGIFYFFNNKK